MVANAKLAWAPLILVSTLGFSGAPSLPIWLMAATERFHLTALHGGMLASFELGCVAVASIVSATLSRSYRNSLLLVIAVMLSIGGNLASFLATDAVTLTAARAVVGIAYGVTLAEITRRAAQMADPHRVFAMQQLGLVMFAAVFFSTVPKLMAAFGPSAPFLYNLAFGALALVSIVWLPSSTSTLMAGAVAVRASKSSIPVGMTFLAITLTFAAQASLWANIAAAAKGSGLRLETLSQILAIGALLNFLAPLAAVRLALRCGRAVLLSFGYLGFAFSILTIALGLGPLWFAAGAIGINLFLLFLAPFLLGTLVALDASGRRAAAGPAFFSIGTAIGPAVGGLVIGEAGFAMLGIIGAIAVGCALTLALAAGSKISATSGTPAQP